MYLTPELVRPVEVQYGTPAVLTLTHPITVDELRMVQASRKRDRAHDITLFIFDGDRLAVIRKHSFPPGVYRAPSGGIDVGEAVDAGACREAWEETGLQIALDRYLLRVQAVFTCEAEALRWTSHVLSAKRVGGELETHDPKEILEVKWSTLDEIQGPIRLALLATGRPLLRYRVLLTDAVVKELQGKGSH